MAGASVYMQAGGKSIEVNGVEPVRGRGLRVEEKVVYRRRVRAERAQSRKDCCRSSRGDAPGCARVESSNSN